MRPGRGAAQHLARKRVSRGGRARYLRDPQTGRLPTWPDRAFITIAKIRITGYTGSQGLDRIGAAALISTCARLHPGADAVLIRLAALRPAGRRVGAGRPLRAAARPESDRARRRGAPSP